MAELEQVETLITKLNHFWLGDTRLLEGTLHGMKDYMTASSKTAPNAYGDVIEATYAKDPEQIRRAARHSWAKVAEEKLPIPKNNVQQAPPLRDFEILEQLYSPDNATSLSDSERMKLVNKIGLFERNNFARKTLPQTFITLYALLNDSMVTHQHFTTALEKAEYDAAFSAFLLYKDQVDKLRNLLRSVVKSLFKVSDDFEMADLITGPTHTDQSDARYRFVIFYEHFSELQDSLQSFYVMFTDPAESKLQEKANEIGFFKSACLSFLNFFRHWLFLDSGDPPKVSLTAERKASVIQQLSHIQKTVETLDQATLQDCERQRRLLRALLSDTRKDRECDVLHSAISASLDEIQCGLYVEGIKSLLKAQYYTRAKFEAEAILAACHEEDGVRDKFEEAIVVVFDDYCFSVNTEMLPMLQHLESKGVRESRSALLAATLEKFCEEHPLIREYKLLRNLQPKSQRDKKPSAEATKPSQGERHEKARKLLIEMGILPGEAVSTKKLAGLTPRSRRTTSSPQARAKATTHSVPAALIPEPQPLQASVVQGS